MTSAPKYVHLVPSTLAQKKFTAIFYDKHKNKIRTTHFGQKGASDYTRHRDPARKLKYLRRHSANEDWSDPMSAGALSRWILWSKPSLQASYKDYRNQFNLMKR